MYLDIIASLSVKIVAWDALIIVFIYKALLKCMLGRHRDRDTLSIRKKRDAFIILWHSRYSFMKALFYVHFLISFGILRHLWS